MAKKGPSRQMLKRIMVIMLAVVIATVSVTSFRLVTIMLVRGEEYQSKASAQQLHDAYIAAERGNIYDTNMNVLAKSATVWTIYVTPNDLTKLSAEESEKVKNRSGHWPPRCAGRRSGGSAPSPAWLSAYWDNRRSPDPPQNAPQWIRTHQPSCPAGWRS